MNLIQEQFNGFCATNQLECERFGSGVSDFIWPLSRSQKDSIHSLELAPNTLLGKKAERFFAHAIESSEIHEMVAENLQIVEDKITLGELDFILRTKENGLVHLELVYKFYLFDPEMNGVGIEKWIGPNRKDALAYKLEKLITKQFPILTTEAAIQTLINNGVNTANIRQELLFLANCFTPLEYEDSVEMEVDGFWMRKDVFDTERFYERSFYIPPKSDWMIRETKDVTWKTHSEICEEINVHLSMERSPLIWIKNTGDSFERAFIVWW